MEDVAAAALSQWTQALASPDMTLPERDSVPAELCWGVGGYQPGAAPILSSGSTFQPRLLWVCLCPLPLPPCPIHFFLPFHLPGPAPLLLLRDLDNGWLKLK